MGREVGWDGTPQVKSDVYDCLVACWNALLSFVWPISPWGIIWAVPSCHVTNNIKALKRTNSTGASQARPHAGHCHFMNHQLSLQEAMPLRSLVPVHVHIETLFSYVQMYVLYESAQDWCVLFCVQMDAYNLAIMFGPALVRPHGDDMAVMLKDMNDQCHIVDSLIRQVSHQLTFCFFWFMLFYL